MNLQHMGTIQQLHADRTAQLQSLRRPRRDRRHFHIPRLLPGLRGVPAAGTTPIASVPACS